MILRHLGSLAAPAFDLDRDRPRRCVFLGHRQSLLAFRSLSLSPKSHDSSSTISLSLPEKPSVAGPPQLAWSGQGAERSHQSQGCRFFTQSERSRALSQPSFYSHVHSTQHSACLATHTLGHRVQKWRRNGECKANTMESCRRTRKIAFNVG
jgi:hypothetical protein